MNILFHKTVLRITDNRFFLCPYLKPGIAMQKNLTIYENLLMR
jgi:hypothetical protein